MSDRDRRPHLWRSRRKAIEGKTLYVRVSMSENERARLMLLETETGMSPSAILVDSALGTGDPASLTVRKEQLATLLEIRRLIATVSNNVNQVAKHLNTTGELSSESLGTVQDARALMRRIADAVEDLKP